MRSLNWRRVRTVARHDLKQLLKLVEVNLAHWHPFKELSPPNNKAQWRLTRDERSGAKSSFVSMRPSAAAS